MTTRIEALNTAAKLITGERAATYGSAERSFSQLGALWGIILDRDAIDPEVVALMLAQLKMARILSHPGHTDSWVDLIGYSALGAEIATERGRS